MLDFSGKYDLACNYFNFLPQVTCKKAEARQGKVYVGKLPLGEALSKEDLQAHFEQFGSVVEVVRPVDKMNPPNLVLSRFPPLTGCRPSCWRFTGST